MKAFINFIINKKVLLFTIGLLLLNIILKILFIESNDIAKDEPFSIFHAQMRIPEIIECLKPGNNPPLYEILLHFWIKLFGISAFSVRLPSLIFSSLTALVIFRTGKSFLSFWTGVAASLIFTFATLQTYYAHEARVYALFMLLGSLSFLLTLNYLKSFKKIFLILLALTDIFMIYAHYFGFFILLNQLFSLFFFRLKKQDYILIAITGGVIILSFLPMISSFITQFYYSVEEGTWVEQPLMSHYYGFLNIFINNKYSSYIYLGSLAILLVIFFIKKKTFRGLLQQDKRKFVFLVFLWFFIPYTVMYAVSFWAPMFIERYVVYTSVFFYLFIASILCLSETNKRIKGFLILLFFSVIIFSYQSNPYNKRDIAKAVSFVKENKKDSTVVLVCPDYDYSAFVYHYNKAFFRNYSQMTSLLENDNIFFISTPDDARLVIQYKKCKEVIYFQSFYQYEDPENKILHLLEKSYHIKEKRSFFEIYTVTVMEILKVPKGLKVS